MKRTLVSVLIAIMLVAGAVTPALAAGSMPVGGCPAGFTLMMVMDMPHMDMHIGLTVDLNQDGWLCMKALANGLHVHMDNVIKN